MSGTPVANAGALAQPSEAPDARILQAILRQDLTAFAQKTFATLVPGEPYHHNWHIDLICDRLERVRRGEIQRLIINLPPRSLKSLLVSVAFPAFVLGHNPRTRIIAASYGSDLATRFGTDTRTVLTNSWYRDLFPATRLASKNASATDFHTTLHGGRLAVSAGGPITGRGAGIILIDDPLKASDAPSDAERNRVNAWFDQNIIQRLDDKTRGAIVVVMQRLHDEDLTGHLLDKGGWEHLKIPAIAEEEQRFELSTGRVISRTIGDLLHPKREPSAVLDEIRRSIGAYDFAGQYQQEPASRQGGLVRADHFPRASLDRGAFDMTIQSWDTAHKTGEHNDYSVCTTWGRTKDDRYFLIDLFRAKLAFPQLIERVRTLYESHRPHTVLIEESPGSASLIAALRDGSSIPIVAVRPDADKLTRLNVLTGLIESGRVILPVAAPWLDDFLLEITRFPRAKHDDQVDSFTQALGHLRTAFRHEFW